MNTKPEPAALWTALYWTPPGNSGCYWLKIGHIRGQNISYETAIGIAKKFIAKKRGWYLADFKRGGPDRWGWRKR